MEGSYFGDVDILVERARGESAIAETDAEVWKIGKQVFLKLLDEYDDVKILIIENAMLKVLSIIILVYDRRSIGKPPLKQFRIKTFFYFS